MRDEAKSIRAQISTTPPVAHKSALGTLTSADQSGIATTDVGERQPLALVFIICVVLAVLAIGAPGLLGL